MWMILISPFPNFVIIRGTFKQRTNGKTLQFNGKAESVGREREDLPQKDACSDHWLT